MKRCYPKSRRLARFSNCDVHCPFLSSQALPPRQLEIALQSLSTAPRELPARRALRPLAMADLAAASRGAAGRGKTDWTVWDLGRPSPQGLDNIGEKREAGIVQRGQEPLHGKAEGNRGWACRLCVCVPSW